MTAQSDYQIKNMQTNGPGRAVKGSIVLDARGIHKHFGGQVVLEAVDLQLRRGQVVLLRGANGSGKTTLLNLLTGNLKPDAGHIRLSANGREERFTFPKPWWRHLNPVDRFAPELLARRGVGRSWQETRLFSTQSLRDNLLVAQPGQLGEEPIWAIFRKRAVARQERELRHKADRMLADLGLLERASSSGDMVSLGQAKRVAIARAVTAGAKVLFLDEPLAGLDEDGIADVMAMLESLVHGLQLTLVIVEHVFNIPRILDLATTVWTLGDGHLTVEPPAAVRSEVQCAIGDGLRAWMRQVAGGDEHIATETLAGGARLYRLRPVVRGATSGDGESVLEVENMVVRRGRRLVVGQAGGEGVIAGLSFRVARGEICVLQAPNGWGKTTLMEAISGLLPIAAGKVRLLGQDITRQPAWARHRVGLSFLQARDQMFPDLRVREMLGLASVPKPPVELDGLVDRRSSDLSGGERQKVAIACALGSARTQMAVIDEPFSALDVPALRAVWSLLEEQSRNCAMLIAVPGTCASDSAIER